MPHPIFRPSATALITGAASGIGLAIAQRCRSHGMRVMLVDRNPTLLSSAHESLSTLTPNAKADVDMFNMDVSKMGEWQTLKKRVEEKFGGVDFLVLNAGIGDKGGWEDDGVFRTIMDTNFFGVVNGIGTFLPGIKAREESTAIVITGSKQGITNPPGNPAYNASKAAVKSVAEHLSYDLRDTNTSVHLLVPGWTFTGLTGGGKVVEKPEGAWKPEQVADFLEERMGRGDFWVICPDGETSEEKDRKRMLWSVGDAVEGRPPLSRWREEWKGKAEEWMEKTKI